MKLERKKQNFGCWRRMQIGDGQDWSFLNGQWVDGPEGELIPPDGTGKEYVAVEHSHEYSDILARFRFKFRYPAGGARFLFRLKDSMRYYALDIPWCGQQNRNKHFWAGIVMADGTPLQRYLHLGLIPGICPEHNRWYESQIECSGTHIRAWIDGRLVADIEDRTYDTGRVGLMALISGGNPYDPNVHKTPHFAELQVSGIKVDPSPWDGLNPSPKHWITPCREVDPETFQSYPNIIMSKSSELTVSIPFGNPDQGETRRTVWVRSTDGGRMWSDPQPPTLQQGFGTSFVKKDGTWVCVFCKEDVPVEQALYSYKSGDEGKTWSGPEPLNVKGKWPEEFSLPVFPSGQILRLHDGTLLLPVSCKVRDDYNDAFVSTNFVFRSTDDGESWSAPVRCDRNNPLPIIFEGRPDTRWFCPADFSEIGLAEAADNVIIGFGRPGPWPYMWQVRSNDGGQTWMPAAFGPFPGYCITLTRTSSDALVAVHRFPYLSANVSYDGGVTWDAGTIIDFPYWANHNALEVEPDVVLVLSMGYCAEPGQADDRVYRLRVTDHGLVL